MRGNPIRDDLLRGRLSRRDLNKMLAAAGLSLVAMPLGRNARAAAGDMTYFTWSGYDLPGLFPGYVSKHGGPPGRSCAPASRPT